MTPVRLALRVFRRVSEGAALLLLAAPLTPQALCQTNLALHKPATQSSTYAADYPASMCVDGDRNSGFCHTDSEVNPWWQVDLGANYALSQIVVYNRGEGFGVRERTIRALLSTDGRTWTAIYSHDGRDFTVLPIDAGGRTARYVRLQLAATDYMNIQEVEVFGSGGAASNPPPQPAPPASIGNWRPMGTGDCTGRDVSGSTGPNPDGARCNAAFNGFTAVCWNQQCTYKNVFTASCTGGANPGRMYRCDSAGAPAALDLGATLTVIHPNVCVAIWTRTQPGVYDAVTVCQGPRNASFRETLTVESNDGRTVVVNRPNYGRYRGTLSADRKTITGTCDWSGCTPGFDWVAYVDRDWRNSPPLK